VIGTTVAGVDLPFPAMNASGVAASPQELRALAASRTGAIVLKTATVHPFLHPEFRSLHNPGYDKIVPLVRELRAASPLPVVGSIAGSNPIEYAILARAMGEAGAAWVEANLADPWVQATFSPLESLATLDDLLGRLVEASPVPVAVKLPERVPLAYKPLGDALAAAGVRIVVIRNDFGGLEKFLLETGPRFDLIAFGGIRSGYDVRRALLKGARAVQVRSALVDEGPAIFARLEREMSAARDHNREPVD
jgi:dihydroorotate dehydrogenase (fumarate)